MLSILSMEGAKEELTKAGRRSCPAPAGVVTSGIAGEAGGMNAKYSQKQMQTRFKKDNILKPNNFFK